MNVFFYYCPQGFGNCYILSRKNAADCQGSDREAIIVDPGMMDRYVLQYLESKKLYPKAILVTHNHENHMRGISSLMRIYDTKIYAVQSVICGYRTNIINDRDIFEIGSFNIEAFSIPYHSTDSVIYKIEHSLFTGDVMSAGMLGSTPSPYGIMLQISRIQNSIFSMEGNFTVFPGHGPPTSLNIERKYNISIANLQKRKDKTRYASYNLDLLGI
ncbi:MAG: MBL fold metallo-hydrolase [Spirochaetaceae bacterium]|jgi:glyoxylase-like metal-dependent hydrolase (beta-lactamase superfamily II)|nr:MBL fold metallo-hydrolase [Spirochaetaceae bacterium]